MPYSWQLIADLVVPPASTATIPGTHQSDYYIIEALIDAEVDPESNPGFIRAIGEVQSGLTVVLNQQNFFTDERTLFKIPNASLVNEITLTVSIYEFWPDSYKIKVWKAV